MSRGTLYTWLKGTVPRIDAIARFAEGASVSLAWLLTGCGDRAPTPVDLVGLKVRLSQKIEESQVEVSNVRQSTLRSWSDRQRGLPKVDGFLALAEALDLSVSWLLTGQGPERPFEGEASGEPPCAESAPVTFSPTLPPGALRVIPASPERTRSIPFLGRIEAGFSAIAIQEAETRDFATWMCPHGDAFALRVHGNSMIEVGIHSGDIVILRATPRATDGDVVAATLGEESMLKLLKRSADGWWLVAANKEMTERRPLDGAIIHGVVHTVVRQFESTSYTVEEPEER